MGSKEATEVKKKTVTVKELLLKMPNVVSFYLTKYCGCK